MVTLSRVDKAVYRFYNTAKGAHFYTANYDEAKSITDKLPSFQYEGVAYATGGTSEFYRFYNKATGTHFFTADGKEADSVKQKLSDTYLYEGVAFQVSLSPGEEKTKLHRFYNPKLGVHFFTADDKEADSIKQKLSDSYLYEGVAAYVASSVPDDGKKTVPDFFPKTDATHGDYEGPLPTKYGEDGKGALFEGRNATIAVPADHKIFNAADGKTQFFVSEHTGALTFDASKSTGDAQLKLDLSGEGSASASTVKLGKGAAMTVILGAGNDVVKFGGAKKQTLEITKANKGVDRVSGLERDDVIDFVKLDLEKAAIETNVENETLEILWEDGGKILLEGVAGLTKKIGSRYKISGTPGDTPEKFPDPDGFAKSSYTGDLPTQYGEDGKGALFEGRNATIAIPSNHAILKPTTDKDGKPVAQVFASEHIGALTFDTAAFADKDHLKIDLSGEGSASKSNIILSKGGAAMTVTLGAGTDEIKFGGATATKQTLEITQANKGADRVAGLKQGDTVDLGKLDLAKTAVAIDVAKKTLQIVSEGGGQVTLEGVAGWTRESPGVYKISGIPGNTPEKFPGFEGLKSIGYTGNLPTQYGEDKKGALFIGSDATIAVPSNHAILQPTIGKDGKPAAQTFASKHSGALDLTTAAFADKDHLKIDLSGEGGASKSKIALGAGGAATTVTLGAGADDIAFGGATKQTLKITKANRGADRVAGLKQDNSIFLEFFADKAKYKYVEGNAGTKQDAKITFGGGDENAVTLVGVYKLKVVGGHYEVAELLPT